VPFPSDEQRAVIDHRGRPMVVIAGPGTGKTKTLVERMITLLKEDSNRNISFVTFTRTSRTDTSRKLTSEFPSDKLEDDTQEFPRVGTMHGSARTILHRFARIIDFDPNFNIFIAEKGERSLIVSEVIDDLGLGFSIPVVEAAIVYMLCNLTELEADKIEPELQVQLFERYHELVNFYRACGMEDIVFLSCRVLEESQRRIPPIFLQVDEYQDLNPTDQHFVSLVASDDYSQVVVVGDDAQSIYQFRHANYKGLHFLWDSEDWEHIRFNDSFRLPAHIQRAAISLIEGEGYLGSVMNVKPESGEFIRTFQCTKSEYQPIVISQRIRDFIHLATNSDGEPVSYSDVMILCPSYNLIPGVMEVLENDGIPSRDISRSPIPEDVWRIILIIRMAFHRDNIAFRQWLDIAGLDPTAISSIRLKAIESGLDLFEFCRQLDNEIIRLILNWVDLVTISYGDVNNIIEAIGSFDSVGYFV
jgi:superfamily I DNA/RNA helicase